MKLMGDSRPRHKELDKQTRTLPTIDLPRQRFGEYYFVPELKIWDRQADRQADTGTSWVAAQLKTISLDSHAKYFYSSPSDV